MLAAPPATHATLYFSPQRNRRVRRSNLENFLVSCNRSFSIECCISRAASATAVIKTEVFVSIYVFGILNSDSIHFLCVSVWIKCLAEGRTD